MRSFAIAIILLATLFTAQPAHADLLNDAIRDYQFQDYAASETKLRQLLARNPDNLMARYYLGAALQQQGKLDEAIAQYEIVARSPQPVQGIEATLANAYVAAGKPARALPYLQKRYRQNPHDDAAAMDYASALQADGQIDAAAAIYRNLIDAGSNRADQARFQLGQIRVNQGAYLTAVKTMRQIDPASPYGNAAKSYVDALAPVTRPINIYASIEGFYNDNPGSSSSTIIGTTTPVTGGASGTNVVASLTTRAEATPTLHVKLGYLYFGTYYSTTVARQLNFSGHFLNPAIVYKPDTATDIELKGDFQFFDFARQKLSTNVGGTLTATHRLTSGHSFNAHIAYLDKQYTRSYVTGGLSTSLEYLDARSTGVGVGATLAGSALLKDWNGSLSIDYTFNDERTKHAGSPNATIAAQSRDSRYREHSVRFNASLPLGLGDTRLSLLANANYTYRDYPNIQSGNTYPSAAGLHMKSGMLTSGARIQMQVWKKIGLNLAAGFEQTVSHSHASELTYKSNRYFGALSASY